MGETKQRLPAWVNGWSLLDRTVSVLGRNHHVEVVAEEAGIHITVWLDDVRVGEVVTPIEERPWDQVSLPIDGAHVVVGIWWTMASRSADVFVDGRSVSNGRSLEQARADASRPVRGFDRWFGYWPIGWLDRFPLPPIWSAPIAIGLIALLAVLPLAERGLRLVLAILVALGWFWIWFGLVARTTAWLRRRQDTNSWLRLGAYLAVLGGFPVLSLTVFVLVGTLLN